MKINVQKDLLLEKLTLSSRFTSSRLSASVVLQGILLMGKENTIHWYATDLNTFFHTSYKTTLSEDFRIVIEPKKIIEFLNLLAPGEVTLEVLEKQVALSQGKTKGSFPLMVTDEFPMPPHIEEKKETIKSSFFLSHLPLLLFTASADETRPVLTGINFLNTDGELLMVATDGFRLSLIKEKSNVQLPSMIIPSDFLGEVVKNAKEVKEVQFSFSSQEKMVHFKIGENDYYSRLVEGEFPPFERVILTETKTKVVLDKAELIRNVKLISVFARDFSNVVVCEFKKDGLYMRPKKEANEENSAYQEVQIEGEEQKVAFNYRFLLDLLNHIEDKQVTIELLRSDAPVAFKLEKNPNFLHIIMPVRIQE